MVFSLQAKLNHIKKGWLISPLLTVYFRGVSRILSSCGTLGVQTALKLSQGLRVIGLTCYISHVIGNCLAVYTDNKM